ncbi:MAG: trypsin-like serine protease [Polyangiaceae bacterium]
MSRTVLFSCFALLAFPTAGCGSEPDPAPVRLGVLRGAIYGGTADTTHDAVVALFGDQSLCTATIIGKSGNTGYALTAAHCVEDPPQVLVQGDDYNSANAIVYNVTDYQADPQYNGGTHDFGMVTFSGASGAPVIPAMTPAEDDLVGGSALEFVGYGVTENNNNNTLRRHVDGEVNDVDPLVFDYFQSDGGPCSGDSGGPSLSLVGGQQRVSGVTSYGGDCWEDGVSGRASAVYNSFIAPYMGGNPPPPGCDQCAGDAQQGGACSNAVQQCGNLPACVDLVDCLNGCPPDDDACVQACATQAGQPAVDAYTGIIDCICDTACVQECATECVGSSSSSSSSSSTSSSTGGPSSAASTGAGAGPGAGGGASPGVGVGGAGTSDDDDDDGDDDDGNRNNDADSEGSCAAAPLAPRGPLGALAAGILVLGLAAARRRRRG